MTTIDNLFKNQNKKYWVNLHIFCVGKILEEGYRYQLIFYSKKGKEKFGQIFFHISENCVDLDLIEIEETYTKKHLGKLFIKKFIKLLKKYHPDYIRTIPSPSYKYSPSEERLIAFYESLGFKKSKSNYYIYKYF